MVTWTPNTVVVKQMFSRERLLLLFMLKVREKEKQKEKKKQKKKEQQKEQQSPPPEDTVCWFYTHTISSSSSSSSSSQTHWFKNGWHWRSLLPTERQAFTVEARGRWGKKSSESIDYQSCSSLTRQETYGCQRTNLCSRSRNGRSDLWHVFSSW